MIELAAVAASKSPSAWDEPGTLGFLVVFGMGVILYFVFRSLAKQLRKVNEAARLEALQAETESAQGGVGPLASTGTLQAGLGAPARGSSRDDDTDSEYERQQSEANAATADFEF